MDDFCHSIFIAIWVVSIIATVSVLYFYRIQVNKREKKYQQLNRKNVIFAQEEERKRIARELHDSVGQALYSVVVGLKIVNQLKMENSMRDHLLQVEKLTAKAMDEVKGMAFELRPSALDDLGLIPALRSYLERYEHIFGIEAVLTHHGQKIRYDSAIETALYRISQEALTNAAKYANTHKVDLIIDCKENQIILKVIDYGEGFERDKLQSSGIGLHSMEERVELIGGKMEIESKLGEGTKVWVQVPV